MFTWVQLSFKFLYSSQQKLHLLVQKSNHVASIDHCDVFPLDLGEEWNEMVGRERKSGGIPNDRVCSQNL